MMKYGLVMMMVAMSAGAAQADTVKPKLGFDRVGLVSADMKNTLGNRQISVSHTRFNDAPGEDRMAGEDGLSARKSELARRLVWLMLSAR
jgi:hypothetical protein